MKALMALVASAGLVIVAAGARADDLTFVPYQVPLKNGRSMGNAMAVNWLHYLGAQGARLDALPPPAADLSQDKRVSVLRKQENTRAFYDHFSDAARSA